MPPHFKPEALQFLADIATHNDRDWFEANKPLYEHEVKAPMLALIGALNEQFGEYAAEHVRPAHKILMRIYRDIRFSKDKRPYKTNVAAWWAREGLEKTSGGGYYFEVNATSMTVAAGVYMPQPAQLLAIRRYIVDHHQELRALLADRKLRAKMREFEGLTLTRVPKGFAAEHPAADLLMQRQWGVAATLPAERALKPGLLKDVGERFRLAAPIVEYLNTPLRGKTRTPLF